MLYASALAMTVCVLLLMAAAFQWVVTEPGWRALRMPTKIPGIDQSVAARRNPFAFVLSRVGRLVPSSRRAGSPVDEVLYPGSAMTRREFRGVRIASVAAGGIVAAVILHELGMLEPLWVGLAAAVGFALPGLWLNARLSGRRRAILRSLPEVIDLLTLCVGAGLDFLGSLQKVVLIKGKSGQDPLTQELSLVMNEIKLGQRKTEALKAMARRVDVPELSSFVRTLVQGERMGTPLGEVLSIHAEDMRLSQFTLAERAALKAPIKILIPLIFCIMPCVALIVGGPIFIQFMRQNPFGK